MRDSRQPSTWPSLSAGLQGLADLPLGRRRGGPVSRLVLHAVIPASAALVIAWGLLDLGRPTPAAIGSIAGTAVASAGTTSPPGSASLRAIAPPTGATAAKATPLPGATTSARREPSPSPDPPTLAPDPSSAGRLIPRPTITSTPTPTPTSVGSDSAGCLAPSPLPPVSAPRPLTTTTEVNFRSGPGVDCDALRVLDGGTTVVPLSGAHHAGGRSWLLVEVDGRTGWVASDFLREAP